MPRATTIAEILNGEVATNVPILIIRGTVVECYKTKSGGSGDRAWTRQDGVLKDATGEIKFKIWNHEPMALNGKNVTFECFEGQKGWTGVFAEENEYNGTVTIQLKITDGGIVTIDNTAPARQQQTQRSPAPHDRASGQSYSQPARQSAAPKSNDKMPILGVLVGNQMSLAIGTVNMKFPELDARTAEYCQVVKQIASNGIRISLDLERGNLSPAPWGKPAVQQQAPPPPPPPEPEPTEPEETDDVPF